MESPPILAGDMSPSPRIRPTRAEINLAALRSNFRLLKKAGGEALAIPVVKANAYGHGVEHVAPALVAEGAKALGVALVEEAVELRELGITAPVLILGLGGGYDGGGYEEVVRRGFWPTVYTPEHVEGFGRAANALGTQVKVHVKIDTGMGRIGALPAELEALLAAFQKHPSVILDGVSSHFANADLADRAFTQTQVGRLQAALGAIRAAGFAPSWRHLGNSAGIFALPEVKDGLKLNAVRPGVALYGLSPAGWIAEGQSLLPVMTWKSGIAHLKTVAAGTPISYGSTWTAKRESRIATIPVGYADGYSRHFSNVGQMLVRGHRTPIAGRVCMDMCMLDVTDVPGAALNDEVVLMGEQGSERISTQQLADLSHTLHYEVVCGVGRRVPRVAV
jgi:alanine racemase